MKGAKTNFKMLENTYIFAHLIKWNNEEEYIQVDIDRVDDIVNAVREQKLINDVQNKIHFDGKLYKSIEILLVNKEDYENAKKELQERTSN